MRLVHVTDPHLTDLDGVGFFDLRGKRWSGYISWHKNRRKKYLPAVLERLVTAVKAENADQLLLTGDLAQIGLIKEIEQAGRWLGELGPVEQVMLVPGNHDVYAHGSADNVQREWAKYLFHDLGSGSDDFPVVRKLEGVSLIGLSSACVTPVFTASGKLGQEQLERLSVLLEQAATERQLVCLLIHHPPLPGMTNRRKGLADAAALQAILEPFPPMLVFHGHLHHNREQQWGDSRIYCTSAASSISDASYRVIDIEDNGEFRSFRMALKSLAMESGDELEFATVDEQTWQLQK
jgi:3',5'-cyclic AMP phosphodiesterase CpdA